MAIHINAWRTLSKFPLACIPSLWIDEEPVTYDVDKLPLNLIAVLNSLEQSCYEFFGSGLFNTDPREDRYKNVRVGRRLLVEIANRRGDKPLFLFPDDDSNLSARQIAVNQYDTKLLKAARWVIATYWEGKDPSQGPTKALIIEKLQDLHALSDGGLPNLTKGEAEAVDLVTRPDSRRQSGR